ncbi:MAG: hypothetical protein IT426_03330 [Pirellulales bacterium]|nr:hypothetical protein [Pirellulales bacterium]
MNRRSSGWSVLYWTAGCSLVTVALLSAVGCEQSGLNLATVRGTVKYQGKALNRGSVVFTPEAGTCGPQAVGMIQPDGTFEMRTNNVSGAVVGKHKVTVILRRILTPDEEKRLVVPESLVPVKYAREEETPLRFEVKPGSNELPLELI